MESLLSFCLPSSFFSHISMLCSSSERIFGGVRPRTLGHSSARQNSCASGNDCCPQTSFLPVDEATWKAASSLLAPTSYTIAQKLHCVSTQSHDELTQGQGWLPQGQSPVRQQGQQWGCHLLANGACLGLVSPWACKRFKRVRNMLAALPEKEIFSSFNLWKQTMYMAT